MYMVQLMPLPLHHLLLSDVMVTGPSVMVVMVPGCSRKQAIKHVSVLIILTAITYYCKWSSNCKKVHRWVSKLLLHLNSASLPVEKPNSQSN